MDRADSYCLSVSYITEKTNRKTKEKLVSKRWPFDQFEWTDHKVKDTESEHLKGQTHVTMVVKPVQHLNAQSVG